MTLTASVIIVWLLIGLVIGGLARLLVPGRQHIGLILTILIGIVAALLGGIITTAIIGAGHRGGLAERVTPPRQVSEVSVRAVRPGVLRHLSRPSSLVATPEPTQ